ncbi:hypothetical protein FACS1894204_07540 [Synergistales bacterium]|nr:hypothetical protein FACS1894204_07540 [Synergistales bacterium]
MNIAVVARPSNDVSQVRQLLTCASLLLPDAVELWLTGGVFEGDKYDSMPIDAFVHIIDKNDINPNIPNIPNIPDIVRSTEEWVPAIRRLTADRKPDAVLFYADMFGAEMAARIGFSAGGSCVTGVSSVSLTQGGLIVERAAYGSNLTARFEMRRAPYILSIAKGAFDSSPEVRKAAPECFVIAETLSCATWHIDVALAQEEVKEEMSDAEVIVVAGRGAGSRKNVETLRRLAESLGGKLGGTRPAVLDGWLKHKYLIGASGNVVRPKLCLAMGVSGSGPFMAGVDKSGTIVAVNNDPSALIFKYCDVGVVDDCEKIADELLRIINN